jgi:hypothetical protein
MDIILHQVDIVDQDEQEMLVMAIEYLDGDGSPLRLVMIRPLDVFETRAAEYDLDADDIDLLIEIIFYEMFLQISDEDKSKVLHFAPTKEIARKELLRRIRKQRGNGKLIGIPGNSPYVPTTEKDVVVASSGDEDPIEFLKREIVISSDHLAVKRQYINAVLKETRQQHKQREVKRAARTVRGRRNRISPEELKRQLMNEGPGRF